jgi:serine/threonine protein kinase
VGNFNGK